MHIVHEVNDLRPAHADVTSDYEIAIQSKIDTLTWIGTLDFKSDAQNFYYSYTRKLKKGQNQISHKQWQDTIPQDY